MRVGGRRIFGVLVAGVLLIAGVGVWGEIRRRHDERVFEDLKSRGARVSLMARSGPNWILQISPTLSNWVGRWRSPRVQVTCGIRFQNEDMEVLARVADRVAVLKLSGDGRMTDRGLENLERFRGLWALELTGRGFSDDCVSSLKKCGRLSSLELKGTRVTDSGIAELALMPGLRQVFVEGIKITDASAKSLGGMPQLRDLALTGSKITNAGMRDLGQLRNLVTLDLRETEITDVGLEELSECSRIHLLMLSGTKVTAQGIAGLKKKVAIDGVVGP